MTLFSELIGWIGNFGFIVGVYAVGKKNKVGWYFNLLGNFMYILQAVLINNTSLFWLSVGLGFLNIKAIIEWRKQ